MTFYVFFLLILLNYFFIKSLQIKTSHDKLFFLTKIDINHVKRLFGMKIFRYRSLWNMIVGHVIIYFWFQLTIFSNMS